MQKAKHPNHAKQSRQHFLAQIRYNFSRMDWWILLIVGLLSVYSLIMVYSSTQYVIEFGKTVPQPFEFVKKQMIGIALGIAVSSVAICIPYKLYIEPRLIMIANGFITILLIITHLFGIEAGGAKSWLNIFGLNIQPGELAKIGLILLMCLFCVRSEREVRLTEERRIGIFTYQTIFSVIFIVADAILIRMQPDTGMVLIVLSTLFLMALVLVIKRALATKLIAIVAALATGTMIWIYKNADQLATSSDHKMRRLGIFVNPFKYAKTAGYQIVNAYIAISRGGLFGRGIGRSLTKQEGLPAGHTDYILAVIGEESGLVGLVVVVLLLSALIFLCFRWAAKSQDTFRRAVFTGIGCLLLVQTTLNIGGVSGLVPLTGVTLPFVSYGGTSMVLTMMLVGVLQVMIIEEKRVLEAQVSQVKEDYHGI